MVDWGKRSPIQPDYSKELLSLYIEVSKISAGEMVSDTFDFSFTCFCVLLTLGLLGLSPQKLDCGAVIADVIEMRQPPWSEAAYTNTENPHLLEGGDGWWNKLCISFGDYAWHHHDEHPANPMADPTFPDRVAKPRLLYPVYIILTQQGEACLVISYMKIELGMSILKFKGLQFSHDTGPVAMGLVMKKHPDGRSRIVHHALIREPGNCVLKYKAFDFQDRHDGHRTKGMVVTKGGRRDGSDQHEIVDLDVVEVAPLYGIRRTWEDFIKDSQERGSGDEVD